MTQNDNWKAGWIWAPGGESPRNEWRCFRKTFQAPRHIPEGTTIKITADSRYILYINGVQAGRGPVRSWPFELAYDEYEIGHLLHEGTANSVSVLVTHYGLSTFQYLRGRGGLLAQIDVPGSEIPLIATDDTWTTAVHAGFDKNSSRISCQLPFTEVVDARAWDESWKTAAYDDARWQQAVVIGPAGMEPWVKLIERDIPYLTEERLYPSRVHSLHQVKPVSWSASIDLRSAFVPNSVNHANNVSYVGLMATVIRTTKSAPVTIGSVDDGRIRLVVNVNGRWFEPSEFTGEAPERYLTVTLPAGDNFLLLDVTGTTHGHGFHLGIDCDEPFEVVAPSSTRAAGAGQPENVSPFVAIGAFDDIELIDHQPTRELRRDHPDFVRAKELSSEQQLAEFIEWIRPIPSNLVNLNDIFSLFVWKKFDVAQPTPASLQNAVTANPDPAVIPVYDGLDTEFVIDFGKELSGYVSFEVSAPDGTIIDLYGFEYMRDGWRQHTYQLDNTLRYVCREGRQTFDSHVRRGLRYLAIAIRGASRPVKLYSVTMIQSNYPVSDIGHFHCSDPLLNDIWQMSRHTTRLCMEDTFVDCPAFEQAYWVGDARNEALINYYAFGAKEIVERCLRLVPGSSFQTPLYADQVPSGWNSVIPNWTFFWVTACVEYYEYSGDVSFAADLWPHVRHTLDHYLLNIDKQGLLNMKGWNLLDWAPFEQPRDGVVSPQNMFLVKALRDAVKLADAAGRGNEGIRYTTAADSLRDAINRVLWDDERAAYIDCIHVDGRPSATTSMQTQVVACLCDIPTGERAEVLNRYLIEPPVPFVQIGSPFMSFFYYEALAKQGQLDRLIADMRAEYGVMVDYEASACWEMYPASGKSGNPKKPTRSHCHAWSAGPAYFLGAYMLGVKGGNPGWSNVTVKPNPAGGVAWARGSVPLPGGDQIDVSWQVSGSTIAVRVSAPAHIKIDIEAPAGYELTVE